MGIPKPDRFYDPDTGSRLLTTKEAAAYLNYHPYSVYRLILRKELRPYRKAGKTLLFLREELDRYRVSNAWAARKSSQPVLAEPPSVPPLQLTARVSISMGFDLMQQQIAHISNFTWDQIPLIHAKTQDQYGQRPSTIEINGPDGGTWRVEYEPPTWLAQIKQKIEDVVRKGQ